MSTTKIFTTAEVPDDLVQQWLQHLRDFDTAHPGCHFQVVADAPEMELQQVVEALRVDPELSFQEVFKREYAKAEELADWLRDHAGIDVRSKNK